MSDRDRGRKLWASVSVRRTGQYSDEDAIIVTTIRGDKFGSHHAALAAIKGAEIEPALVRANHIKITFDPEEVPEEEVADLVEAILLGANISVSRT